MLLNMYYMHYVVYISRYSTDKLYISFLFCIIDVIGISFFSYLCTLGRKKYALWVAYAIVCFFVIINIGYSRFFGQYASLDMFKEMSNFKGTWWLQYIPRAFAWSDIFLVVTTILYVLVIKRIDNKPSKKHGLVMLALLTLLNCFYIVADSHRRKLSLFSCNDMKKWVDLCYGKSFQDSFVLNQEILIFRHGVLKTQVFCNIARQSTDLTLSAQDMSDVNNYIRNKNNVLSVLSDSCKVKGTPNIIFIIVESYMSVASTIQVNGKYITPNLNALMNDPETYSNLTVCSNKGPGESSDAQISYFTGLIPLKSEMSILHVIRNKVISIPALLRDQKGYNTYITIPTEKYFWHQIEANIVYGIDNIIEAANKENNYWCNDEELFKTLRTKSTEFKEPYFNVILTLSMHGEYDEDFLASQNIKAQFKYPESFSKEFCHYLDKCYYTDKQIGDYISYLKESKQYENSVIVICSDHQTQGDNINMNKCSKDLPLLLINTGVTPDHYYDGRINQIDIYPTMLDLFDLKTQWRGIGYSLLRDHTNSNVHIITDRDRNISDKIILGDYFSKLSDY